MRSVNKALDKMLAEIKKEIKEEIASILNHDYTLWDAAEDCEWSNEFFDDVWKEMQKRGQRPIWLLYVFAAAVRAGDIKGEMTIYDVTEWGKEAAFDSIDLAIMDWNRYMEPASNCVMGMVAGTANVIGVPVEVSTSFTAKEDDDA